MKPSELESKIAACHEIEREYHDIASAVLSSIYDLKISYELIVKSHETIVWRRQQLEGQLNPQNEII